MYGHPRFGYALPRPRKGPAVFVRRLVVWGVSAGVSLAFLGLSAALGGWL
jgi:hypothetical protein